MPKIKSITEAGRPPSNLQGFESTYQRLGEPYQDGYEEGYLRGRASKIISQPPEIFSMRQLHILFVSSGKGYPYSPIDEAITTTLHSLVTEVTVINAGTSIAEATAQISPDLVLILDGTYVDTEEIDNVREQGVLTAVWLTDDPYYSDLSITKVRHYDYVFTLELNCVRLYKQLGCEQVYYLPFGVHTEHYQPHSVQVASTLKRDVRFIGSAYWNRIHFLHPILPHLMKYNTSFNGIWWDRLPEFPIYQHKIELGKWMGPVETAAAYNASKIVINLHRSHEDDTVNKNSNNIAAASPNPRTFEISACGTLQLSDERDDLARFYEPGKEIVTYSSPQDLLEKIEFYLTHEKERQEIALAALERTYRDHSYSIRVNELLSIVFS
ncbi:spore maturation protein CgeB [Paenibacillus sp. DS2015]|uniref:CgeB family protein n=1 Tax=Paenibacillus sp. DS2015 TaxID=3373917 RepID=UPI003D1F37EC